MSIVKNYNWCVEITFTVIMFYIEPNPSAKSENAVLPLSLLHPNPWNHPIKILGLMTDCEAQDLSSQIADSEDFFSLDFLFLRIRQNKLSI